MTFKKMSPLLVYFRSSYTKTTVILVRTEISARGYSCGFGFQRQRGRMDVFFGAITQKWCS